MEDSPGKTVAVLEPAPLTGTQLITLDPATYVTQVYAPFVDKLAAAKAEAAKITTIDVSTKQGLALAVKHRAAFRTIRLEAENARVARKAPILAIGKLLDSRNHEIADEAIEEEERFDDAIKADERRKAEQRQAEIRAEQERAAAEELAKKEAEEQRLAAERARIDADKAELARQQAALREAQEKAEQARLAAEAASRLRIEEEERAARMRREEEERQARAARELAEREALEKQQRNQDALSEITGIQQQVIIAQTGRLGVRAGGTIDCIMDTLAETEAWPVDAEKFGIYHGAAMKAKDTAVTQIKGLLAAAEQRAAEDARRRAEQEALDKQRAEAEAAQRVALEAEEAKAAAARREQEERERAERDRLEAEARARAEEERKVREAEEARQREEQRQVALLADGYEVLQTFVARYGEVEKFSAVTADIKDFLVDAPIPVSA